MNRRAFTLMEMIAVTLLFSVCMVIALNVYTGSMRLIRISADGGSELARLDAAAALLRSDAWGCDGFTTQAESAEMRQPGGSVIVWRIEADEQTAVLHRTTPADNNTMTWRDLPGGIAFAEDGPCVVLHVGRSQARFVSQLLLARQPADQGGNSP
jgi:prepilin-type N-terminal cleavage/methylation domain-containing protein